MPVGGRDAELRPRLITTPCALGPETPTYYEVVRGGLGRTFSQITVVASPNSNASVIRYLGESGAEVRQLSDGQSPTYEALKLAVQAEATLFVPYICRVINWARDPSGSLRDIASRRNPVFIARTESAINSYPRDRKGPEKIMSSLMRRSLTILREVDFNGSTPTDFFGRAFYADGDTYSFIEANLRGPNEAHNANATPVDLDSWYYGQAVALLLMQPVHPEVVYVDSLFPLHDEGLSPERAKFADQLRSTSRGFESILHMERSVPRVS